MGEIHVTHKEKHPYSEWKLADQAEKHGLVLKESVKFKKADYPGYTSRRGAGSQIGETFNLGKCRTYMFIQREPMATTVLLPKLSPEAHATKSLEIAILELESQLQARKGAETAKLNWKASLSHLRTLADKVMKEKDEYKRQRDDALHVMNEAWREKENTSKQLTKALCLKDTAIKQKDVSLEKVLSELEFKRQALNAAETEKADLEVSFDHYKLSVCKELKKMDQLVRQRDDALYQIEQVCRDREIIVKKLDDAFRLQKDANGKSDKILQGRNNQIKSRWKSCSRWTWKSLALFCCNFGDNEMESHSLL